MLATWSLDSATDTGGTQVLAPDDRGVILHGISAVNGLLTIVSPVWQRSEIRR